MTKFDRDVARAKILNAANAAAEPDRRWLRMRHIQQAVFRCRQRQLVSDDVLLAAGFNPRRERKR